MRATLVAVVLMAFAAGCGGSDDEESDGKTADAAVDPGNGTTPTIQCSKTATCDWGEQCVDHLCVTPDPPPGSLAFDFAAKDECPGSSTYGEQIALSDFHGRVVLLYFSSTTCDACKADVKEYEALVGQMEGKGFVGMAKMITVVLPMQASALPEFVAPLQQPVVVDETGIGIADHYGAAKDTVVLVDGAGYVRQKWPKLEMRPAPGKDKPKIEKAMIDLISELL
jgi:peroxiredoxin